jgi:hypothetical protein
MRTMSDRINFSIICNFFVAVCKRIRGLAGDTVYVWDKNFSGYTAIQVPPKHVWLLGDNPSNSNDSRNYGPVPVDFLRGKVLYKLGFKPSFHFGSINTIFPFSVPAAGGDVEKGSQEEGVEARRAEGAAGNNVDNNISGDQNHSPTTSIIHHPEPSRSGATGAADTRLSNEQRGSDSTPGTGTAATGR